MKKFYFLLIAAIVATLNLSAGKVYFTNPNNWKNVNAHYWGSNTTPTTWPGKAMTQVGDLWEIEIPGTPDAIIFNTNTGSPQTGNLPYVDGATYDMNGVVGAVNPEWTVYFDNATAGYAKVYCYTYNAPCTGAWPGTEMTLKEGTVYEITFSAAIAPENVIFTDNAGKQTPNLEFENGATYNENGKVNAEPVEYTVLFDNTNSEWEEVYAYAWTGETPADQAYPGTKMTELGGNLYQYTITAINKPANILFNNGKTDPAFEEKTPDFTFTDNETYSMPVPPADLYLTGDFNNWNPADADYHFNAAGNIYELTYKGQLAGAWKITDGTFDWTFGMGESIELEAEAASWFNGQNFTLPPFEVPAGQIIESTSIVFTLVNGSDVLNSPIPSSIIVSYNLTGGEVTYKELYITGDIDNWANDASEAYKMTRTDNVYTFTYTGQLEGAFKITDGSWDYNFGSGLDLTSDPDATLATDTNNDAWFNSVSNFVFAAPVLEEGKKVASTEITFTLVSNSDIQGSSTPSQIVLTYKTTSGVEIVTDELSTPAAYYNLQGVRVENPANGIFIKVQGNKAQKVYVK